MNLINSIRKILNPLKLDLKIFPNEDLRRRKKLLDHYEITKILDVGANSGQYALETFRLGYKGEIFSFEPVNSTYKYLEKQTKRSAKWRAYNYGFGDKEESLEMNLSQNTYSSSLLEIMPNHVKSAPESKVVGKEVVMIKTIDSVFNNFIDEKDKVLLKIDVQGFEKKVLDGAIKSLDKIEGIQIEMSLEVLYQEEVLYIEMINFLKSLGFELHSLENGFFDKKTGKLLQVDGIFFR